MRNELIPSSINQDESLSAQLPPPSQGPPSPIPIRLRHRTSASFQSNINSQPQISSISTPPEGPNFTNNGISPSIQVTPATPTPIHPVFRFVSPATAARGPSQISPRRLRPQWARRRRRHFDSSPELPTIHCMRCNTDKSPNEFSERNEPLCNACREQVVCHLLIFSSNITQDADRLGRPSSAAAMRFNPSPPSPTTGTRDLIDFNSLELWSEAAQNVIDDFRLNLQQWTISFCPICQRIHPFSRTRQTVECAHCKAQRSKDLPSHFGAENDMDPGAVSSSSCYLSNS